MPELIQWWMTDVLVGLPGIICQMDDILIFGKDQTEHDQHLETALKCILNANGTLIPPKYEFSKTKITFLGYVIDV